MTHDKIAQMRDADINLGTRVEIIIKEGAEWYNGWTPAPTVNPTGYCVPDDASQLTDKPGLCGVGYVGEFKDDRVTLAPTWGRGDWRDKCRDGPVYRAGSYFVEADVIHSFRRL